MDDDQAIVLASCLGVFANDRFEVIAVIGGNGPAMRLCDLEDIGIAEPPQRLLVSNGDDVITPSAQTLGHLAADLLVEE